MSTQAPGIELRDLTKRFGDGDEVPAVDHVSLDIEVGELVVFLGRSGSGKTTILRMINRLIEPTSGTVRVLGQDTRDLSPWALRRQIGYVFQRIGLFPHLSVQKNIGVTPSLLGWPPERIRRRVDALLELVELEPSVYRHRRPAELSGGQQQRVGVARALAAEPKVMLLDEPFGALDPATREVLQDRFQTIRKQLDLTAVFVTHDVAEAVHLGDRIAVMRNARLVQLGSARALLEHPADEEIRALIETPRRQAERLGSLFSTEREARA